MLDWLLLFPLLHLLLLLLIISSSRLECARVCFGLAAFWRRKLICVAEQQRVGLTERPTKRRRSNRSASCCDVDDDEKANELGPSCLWTLSVGHTPSQIVLENAQVRRSVRLKPTNA